MLCRWQAAAVVVFSLATAFCWGQPSTSTVTYQGVLTQNGTPVPDGAHTLTFKIYDAASGGNVVETISVPGVMTTQGRFAALVPVTSRSFNGADRWWSVTFNGSELPRQRVTTVPFAISVGPMWYNALQNRVLMRGNGRDDLIGFVPDAAGGRIFLKDSQTGNPRVTLNVTESLAGMIRLTDGNNREVFFSPTTLVGYDTAQEKWRLQTVGQGVLRLFDEDSNETITLTGAGGHAHVKVLTISGADLAEQFDVAFGGATQAIADTTPLPGMVMSIDPANPGKLMVSTDPYDKKVAGIISGANGVGVGIILGQGNPSSLIKGKYPVAMTGRVWVYADDSNGTITAGDRLTTSGVTPGYAMRVTDHANAPGSVIGKAMTAVDKETGMCLVLVNLQ